MPGYFKGGQSVSGDSVSGGPIRKWLVTLITSSKKFLLSLTLQVMKISSSFLIKFFFYSFITVFSLSVYPPVSGALRKLTTFTLKSTRHDFLSITNWLENKQFIQALPGDVCSLCFVPKLFDLHCIVVIDHHLPLNGESRCRTFLSLINDGSSMQRVGTSESEHTIEVAALLWKTNIILNRDSLTI